MNDALAELLAIERMLGLGAGAVLGGIIVLAVAEYVRNLSRSIAAVRRFKDQGFAELDDVEIDGEHAIISKMGHHAVQFRLLIPRPAENGAGYWERVRTVDNVRLSAVNICRLVRRYENPPSESR